MKEVAGRGPESVGVGSVGGKALLASSPGLTAPMFLEDHADHATENWGSFTLLGPSYTCLISGKAHGCLPRMFVNAKNNIHENKNNKNTKKANEMSCSYQNTKSLCDIVILVLINTLKIRSSCGSTLTPFCKL